MENKSKTIEVTLSQESVEAIANAMAGKKYGLLNDFLIPLKEDLDAIERNSHKKAYKCLSMEKKGIYIIAKSENLCKFAVHYSFGVLHPYILAQSLSEPPPRPKNEL